MSIKTLSGFVSPVELEELVFATPDLDFEDVPINDQDFEYEFDFEMVEGEVSFEAVRVYRHDSPTDRELVFEG